MKRLIVFLGLSVTLLAAESLQEQTIATQAQEIKNLQRELGIKKQEIKILLITIKNQQKESMLSATNQPLEFSNISKITPTKVVLKPSMLSEEAIQEIDRSNQTDTDTLAGLMPNSEQNMTVIAPKPNTTAQKCKTQTVDKNVTTKAQQNVKYKLVYTKPSKFKLTHESFIYGVLGEKPIGTWEEGKAFTSNRKKGPWILITGEISKKGWVQVKQKLWINEDDIKKSR